MNRSCSANIAHYVRNLWVWSSTILVILAASASAQERADAPEPKPPAAVEAPPPSKPVPQTSSATAKPAATKPATQAGPEPDAALPTAATPSEPGAAILRLITQKRDALGRRCELQDTAKSGALRLLACGPAGIWVVRLSTEPGEPAVLVSQQDLGGNVQRFFQAEDRLWVEVSSVRAQQLGIADAVLSGEQQQAQPTAAAAEARTASATPARAQPEQSAGDGKVLSQTDEELQVALSTPARPGDHVALIGADPERAGELGEQQIFAVGAVTRSWQDGRASVAIGINERVPLTAAARFTHAPTTAGEFAPPRAAGIWEVGFLARPFLVLENLGVGAMVDAYVGYRGRAPYHIEATFTPLALGAARAGTLGATGAFVSGAFDSRLFEVGLGVGAQTVNDPDFALDPGSGLLLAEQLRIGARDGAHLRFLSYVALFHSNFQFSSLRVEAQVPVGARTWLRLAGGGGTLGLNFGEVGLRVLMSGNGEAGSFFFTTVAGWANLYRNCNDVPQVGGPAASSCRAADYSGPMLGAGGEFRL